MIPVVIASATLTCAAGRGLDAVAQSLRTGVSGLRPNDLDWIDMDCHIGRVEGIEEVTLPNSLADYDCRNNRLAELGLTTDGFLEAASAAAERHGADRVAVVLGTSTSGIQETELAYQRRDSATGRLPASFKFRRTHEYYSLADFVRRRLGLAGPAHVVSTACSSSSKAFVDAYRLIATGLCDAAVVGGVDTLCRMTLHGFASLELLSAGPCRPNDAERSGINIGEAAGFALLERSSGASDPASFARLVGYGESSDGYHMSAPSPEGRGARLAMSAALKRAGLDVREIGYVNLHGTGTVLNDQVEDLAMYEVFGKDVPCSSTKGWTGHTLGAAGVTGVLIAGLAMRHRFLPHNLNMTTRDPSFRSNILQRLQTRDVRYVMANAFGFGGSNSSIILGASP
jgi:3-oxoacyl-[acyl-carrier-protein] synthase-1